MKNKKTLILSMLPLVFAIASCGSSKGESSKGESTSGQSTSGQESTSSAPSKEKITIWTFTNELKKIGNQYNEKFGANVNVVVWDKVDDVVGGLMDAYDSGDDIPDIVALESAVVKDVDIQPYLMPLNDITGIDQMYDYTKKVASNENGDVFGLSWQATPGGFFYKEKVVQELGLTDENIANYLTSWNGFFELAELCKNHKTESGQKIAVVSSITEPIKVFMSSREKAWVSNNVLQLEKVMFGPTAEDNQNCFDVVRSLHQNGYTHESSERTPVWYADVDSDTCLGYFASCWGLNFDLMENAQVKNGWRMCKAPVNYFKGGTWLSVPNRSGHKQAAKDFIKYVTTDEEFLTQRCIDTGDFMNNKKVMNEIVKTYECPFLDGQNHFELLVDVADQINGDLISPYDSLIDSKFTTIVADFAEAKNLDTKEKIEEKRTYYKNNFRTAVKNKYRYIDTSSYPND